MSIVINTKEDIEELEENIVYGLVEPQTIISNLELSDELKSIAIEMGFTFADNESSSKSNLEEDLVTQKINDKTEVRVKKEIELKNKKENEDPVCVELEGKEKKTEDLIEDRLTSLSKLDPKTTKESDKMETGDIAIEGTTSLFEHSTKLKKVKDEKPKKKKETQSFLSKLFGKKKDEPEEVKLRTDYLGSNDSNSISAVESIKKYLLNNQLMSLEDIKKVDKYIEKNSAYTRRLYFLDTACCLNLLDEETCAKVLSINKSTDVISSRVVEKNWARVLQINSKIFKNKTIQDYFVLDVNGKYVTVVTDPEYSKPNTSFYDIEIEYTGYTLTKCSMLDSSFAQTVSKLNKELLNLK